MIAIPPDFPQPLDLATPPNLDLRWIVSPWICRKRITIVAGEGGSAKSLLLFDLSVAIASGSDWIGHSGDQTRVVYIDQDQGEADTWIRLDGFARGRGIALSTLQQNLFVFSGQGFRLDDLQSVETMHSLFRILRPGLIVFDALSRFHRAQEKENSDMAKVSAELRRIAECGPAVVMVHHLKKHSADHPSSVLDRVRGASDLVNASDSVLSVRREGTHGRSIVKVERSRLLPEAEWPPETQFDCARTETGVLTLSSEPRYLVDRARKLIFRHNLSGSVRTIQASLADLGHKFGKTTIAEVLRLSAQSAEKGQRTDPPPDTGGPSEQST